MSAESCFALTYVCQWSTPLSQGAEAIRGERWLAISLKGTRGTRSIVSADGCDLTPRLDRNARPEPMPHAVRVIGQAFALHAELLRTGDEVRDVARRNGIHPSRAHHILHLTRLSPDIIRATLTGTLGRERSLGDLHAAANHLDWSLQARHLGLTEST